MGETNRALKKENAIPSSLAQLCILLGVKAPAAGSLRRLAGEFDGGINVVHTQLGANDMHRTTKIAS